MIREAKVRSPLSLLLALALAPIACGRAATVPPKRAPAATVIAAPPPPAPAPAPTWTAPARCHVDAPIAARLDQAFAALPPLAELPRAALPPVEKRGARARIVDFREVVVQVHLRPHQGMYFGLPPAPDADANVECGFAVALPRLAPADRDALTAILAGRKTFSTDARAADAGPPLEAPPSAESAARFAHPSNGTDTAASLFVHALLTWMRPHGYGASDPVLTSAGEAFRRVKEALPVTDPIGARARLALIQIIDESTSNADEIERGLDALAAAPLAWATADALLGLARMSYDRGAEMERALRQLAIAASIAPDARTKASALLFASRIELELARPLSAFAYADAVARSADMVAALDGPGLDSLASTVGHELDGLPDSVVDALAAWPRAVLSTVLLADSGRARLRDARLFALAGQKADSLSPEAPTADDVQFFVNDCAAWQQVTSGRFNLTVTVFAAGPPEVTVRGDRALEPCLRERAPAYFERATTSVKALVSIEGV